MEDLVSINQLELLAIPDLCTKNFYIPEFQRGYRWGDLQITQLLEDLYSFFYDNKKSSDFYCLQPIVVKKMSKEQISELECHSNNNNDWYEVIDGQQRLTTIRIILALSKLLDEDKILEFPLYYKTRPKLGEIFSKFQKTRKENRIELEVDSSLSNLDIDSWHIFEAAKTIIKWFQTETKRIQPTINQFKGTFYENFTNHKDKKSVQVIWYEVRDESDPYDMFKRLNDQKVSLNNAELIRAMFLSDSASFKCDDKLLNQFNKDTQPIVEEREQARKQSHIIEQWDIIESQLRNEKFWAFIKDDNDTEGYSCRIEYIFDLISRKKSKDKDALYTFLEFDNMLKDGEDLWDIWLKVETYYSLLKSWFENKYYYHDIGYLVAVLGPTILADDLLPMSANYSKTEFRQYLHKKIQETITDSKHPETSILDYTYDENNNLLKNVLFLYNVKSVLRQGNEFFPFDKYKNKGNWTLEHIHAQNSEKIDQSNKEKWVIWFDENLKTLERLQKGLPDDMDLCKLTKDVRSERDRFQKRKDTFSFKDLTIVFDWILNYFDNLNKKEGKSKEIHSISNLALLSGDINTSIGNSVFEVKRQKIMEADASGEYIPYCTRKVFLKYYNKDNEDFTVQQNFFWSEKDRENYLKDIKETLGEFIENSDETVVTNQMEESEVTNGEN